ncbi:metallophosphoesterase family protein, partial [Candidatus Sumerlaeota bacterium]
IHVWRFALDGDLYPKRFLGLLNLALRRRHKFPRAIAERLVAKLLEEEADAVLFSGDLTSTAASSEFVAARELLLPVAEKWGERFLAIPGNHDRYTPRAVAERKFERLFLEREQTYPFVQRLSDTLSVVGIDLSVPRLLTSRGLIGDEQLGRLRDILRTEEEQGRGVIVLGHYPLIIRYPGGGSASWEHRMTGWHKLREVVDRPPVIAYLHGHRHQRWVMSQSHCLEIDAGSAGRAGKLEGWQAGYLRLDFERQSLQQAVAVCLQPGAYEQWAEKTMYPASD